MQVGAPNYPPSAYAIVQATSSKRLSTTNVDKSNRGIEPEQRNLLHCLSEIYLREQRETSDGAASPVAKDCEDNFQPRWTGIQCSQGLQDSGGDGRVSSCVASELTKLLASVWDLRQKLAAPSRLKE